MSETETWRTVAANPRYVVSDAGRVRSPYGRVLKPQSDHPYGYQHVQLGRGNQHYVHRLVAAAFIGDVAGMDVEHVDGDTENNAVTNLLIVTHAENMRRQRLRKPACKRGHLFAVHGGWSRNGRRFCRECARVRDRRRSRRRSVAPRKLRPVTTPWALEDVEWMARGGESLQGAATRLGIKPDALERLLRLHERADLLRDLRSRDPLPMGDYAKRRSA
jgi:hypothetical protein